MNLASLIGKVWALGINVNTLFIEVLIQHRSLKLPDTLIRLSFYRFVNKVNIVK